MNWVRNRPRLIAFYLPQYHPIRENDQWWGKGFTEWRNVAKAQPLFRGHHQPQLPADLGFYDLRVPETREAQAELAREYGISAFCYYYYWFEGRKVLERPLEEVLRSGRPDFPFCLCWANENWTRRWDGFDQEVLLAQRHSPETDAAFLQDVLPILADPRYLRVDGKPLLIVYRVELMPDPAATARAWRRIAAERGLGDLHLCFVQVYPPLSRAYFPHLAQAPEPIDPRAIGFDAAVEFPPHGMWGLPDRRHLVSGLRPSFSGRICSYQEMVDRSLARRLPPYRLHRGVTPAWDNTARRGDRAWIAHGSTPESYERWLRALVDQCRGQDGEQLIFINAWNEWAEGAHLEPDLRSGLAYLEATRSALRTEASDRRPESLLEAAAAPTRPGLASSNGRPAPNPWPLATQRRKRLLAWPDWREPRSVIPVLRLIAEAGLANDPDLCLCLRVDPEADPSPAEVSKVLTAAANVVFGQTPDLEVLLVNDALAEAQLPLLGAAVLGALTVGTEGAGPSRRWFLDRLRCPVWSTAHELRALVRETATLNRLMETCHD